MIDVLAYMSPRTGPISTGPDLFTWLGAWVALSPLGLLAILASRALFALGHRVADLDPVHASSREPRAGIR